MDFDPFFLIENPKGYPHDVSIESALKHIYTAADKVIFLYISNVRVQDSVYFLIRYLQLLIWHFKFIT